MEAIASIGMALFFPEAKPAISALVTGLVSIGATAGATYGSDAISNTAAQMPTLVVPPDKNDEAALRRCGVDLPEPTGQRAQRPGEPRERLRTFLYPLLSNVGLLEALANLNPLVLGDAKGTATSSGRTIRPPRP